MVVSTDLGVEVFPASAEGSVLLPNKHVLYVTTRNDSQLQGYSLRASKPGVRTACTIESIQTLH